MKTLLTVLLLLVFSITNAQYFIGTNGVQYVNKDNPSETTAVLQRDAVFAINKEFTILKWQTATGIKEFLITKSVQKSKSVFYFIIYSNTGKLIFLVDYYNSVVSLISNENEYIVFNIKSTWEE